MTEDAFLAGLRKRLAPAHRRLVLGIGDDAAVFRPQPGRDLVFTTDMMHEDRHFLRGYPADAVGWKALARGLSDIAAMGARPEFTLLSLALGAWAKEKWVHRFYDGFLALAAAHGLPLAGGDLARAAHTSLDVVVAGSLPRGAAFRRDGARPGHRIYVSGLLGGGSLGLRQPRNRSARLRHLRPDPRVALGLALRKRALPTAMLDLSDGLSTDLRRLLLASGVTAHLDGEIPRFPGATEDDALHGGDDYELLFTVRADARVPASLAGLPLTWIGTIHAGNAGLCLRHGHPLPPRGWDHFVEHRTP
ncbi:MAG: thiamine-phosphate kinase [Bryobacterales bacterium]|nr:thiamine-phosphate kinase [Bryobacterales bacterium]